MRKLLYTFLGLTITIHCAQSQSPINTPDNIGGGNCLEFERASNNNVDVDNIGNDIESATQGTIEAWIKLNTGTGANAYEIFSGGTNSLDYFGTDLQQNNRVIFFLKTGGTIRWKYRTLQSLNVGEWYHIAFTQDGIQPRIYINGIEASTELESGSTGFNSFFWDDLPSGNHWGIGNLPRNDNNFNHFDGQIDEVRIWNTARTQAQIKDDMCAQLQGNETGLVGYWNMNEGTGNTVSDLTTNANHGTRQ